MKKVSIVLPVYNGEENVGKAIESILKQEDVLFELIVVNDCSTDRTREIIEKYAREDERIKIINNEKNMKLPSSLNIGFEYATGEYWTWTSDDNILKSNMLKRLVSYLEKDEEVGMVYGNITNIDGNGIVIGEQQLGEPDMISISNPVGACFLYRREVATQVGRYDENLFLAEDYDYWIRICKKFKVSHVKENLYYYRVHEKSLSATKKEQVKVQTYKVMEKHFIYLYFLLDRYDKKCVFWDRMLDYSGDLRIKRLAFKLYKPYLLHALLINVKK